MLLTEKQKEYKRKWYADHIVVEREKRKQYQLKNKERFTERKKAYGILWRKKNRNKHINQCKEWRLKNPERVKWQNDKYSLEHHEENLKRGKEWYRNNKKKAHEITRRCHKKRLIIDPIFKLRLYSRIRINQLLKQKRDKGIEKFLGYTMEQLKEHLEKQFLDGMTWDNYGEWHIDHIKPVSKTILFGTIEEVKESSKLENLQPLWAIDNIKKGNK